MADYQGTGVTVGVDDVGSSPAAYTNVGELMEIGDISQSRNAIDVTDLASTFEEIKAGILRMAPITLSVKWDPDDTGQDELRAALAANTEKAVRLAQPDSPATNLEFTCYLMSVSRAGFAVDTTMVDALVVQPTSLIANF